MNQNVSWYVQSWITIGSASQGHRRLGNSTLCSVIYIECRSISHCIKTLGFYN